MNPPISLTSNDKSNLRLLIASHKNLTGSDAETLWRLSAELDRAHVYPEYKMPEGFVRMNSTVELEDLSDGEFSTYTLVYPHEASAMEGRISIIASLGAGMLGFKQGDEFEWQVPGGTVRMRIRKVENRASPACAS